MTLSINPALYIYARCDDILKLARGSLKGSVTVLRSELGHMALSAERPSQAALGPHLGVGRSLAHRHCVLPVFMISPLLSRMLPASSLLFSIQ